MQNRNRYIDGWLNYQLPHPFRAEAERTLLLFDTNTYKQDGVIRWKSNNQVPPEDILEFWKFMGRKFNIAKTLAAKKREDKQFIEQYIQNQKEPTAEELYEMQAAFGKGTTVVDVISGRKIKL